MTEKQFKVEVSQDNYVHFSENGVNVISIGFKEYADAEDCRNSLLPFCNRLNNLSEQNKELKGLIDLFAQDICDLTELLCENNIDYKLHSDVTNFIIKWGIRID